MGLPLRYELDSKCFSRLSSFIDTHLGIKMPETKKVMLESRLQKRLKALNMISFEDYCNYLTRNGGHKEESVEFFNVVTTNKTDFYREIAHFQYLEKSVLPEKFAKGKKSLKFWSCACSSGEEPYTISFVLDQFKKRHSGFTFTVDATDISTKVLNKAKEALYTPEQVEVIPEAAMKAYFDRESGPKGPMFRVKPDIRRQVSLSRYNLMTPSKGGGKKYDVIFCRNVLIYFSRERQEMIIKNLLKQLDPDGYLFLGHSESMAGMNLNLKAVTSAVYQLKDGVLP